MLIVGCIVTDEGAMVALRTGTGEAAGSDGELVVVPGAELGEAAGAGDNKIGALDSDKGVGTGGGIIAPGIDAGESVGADSEMLLGNIVGRTSNNDGAMVSSINGVIDGDGAAGDRIGTENGRILTTGASTGLLLGKLGTAFPGARTESKICTIPLQPSIFVATTVALSNLTGPIVTTTEVPSSRVSKAPALIFSTKCNPGSIW